MARAYTFFVVITTLCLNGYAVEPHSVGLENMAKTLRGDVRLIAMGDSYSVPYFSRVPLAGLRVWPIPNIAAIQCGASTTSHLFRCTSDCSPVANIQSSDGLGYTVEREGDETFFTLPNRGLREIYTSDTFNDLGTNQLFEFKWNYSGNVFLSNGVHGPFNKSGDNLSFRFLYRCPTSLSQQIETVNILDNSEIVGTMLLRDQARPYWHLGENPNGKPQEARPMQINAASVDYSAINNLDGLLKMHLEQTEPLAGTNQYFEPAGCVYYHKNSKGERLNGFYYSYMADDSWSYSGFGCDTAGSNTHDKKFSLEQFTYWLDVTTLDRNQTTVFMWYFAPEQLSFESSLEYLTNMITQTDEAAELVGLSSVQHLIVISHLFDMEGEKEQARQYFLHQQNAAYEIASTRENVSAASIFEATDKILFSDSSAVPWLLEHGFDSFVFGSNELDLVTFSNGDLLAAANIHPKNEESAAFFTAILGDIIREAGCPADIKVDGMIDVLDLLLIIDGWGTTGASDINNDGTTDVNDIILLIGDWGECWPVQAPFNSPAFQST